MSTDEREEAAVRQALAFVASASPAPALRERARNRLERARSLIGTARIASYPITINFHPDRPVLGSRSVLEAMALDGRVRNQFEVGITNGELGTHSGGRRRRRETELFGGAYDAPGLDAGRPKYGAVDLLRRPLGGWPRFGSSHLVLRPAVLWRSTFSVGNGLAARSWVTTHGGLERLLAEVLAESGGSVVPRRSWRSDGWIEVQIHGTLRLVEDVAALVLDPSFRGTETQRVAKQMCADHGIALRWSAELGSDPTTWSIPAARVVPRAVANEWTSGEQCTAAVIGRLLYHDSGYSALDGVDPALRDGVAKYFWNRTLLSDDAADYQGRSG